MSDLEIRCSHSEAEAFRKCERAHYYSYGQRIRGVTISTPLFKGNIGHKALEIYYIALSEGKSSHDAEQLAYRAMVSESKLYECFDKDLAKQEVGKLLEDYFNEYRVIDSRMDILFTEVELDAEVTSELTIPMRVDLIARVPGYGLVAYDHKFTADFFNPDLVDINPQLPLYKAAINLDGRFGQVREIAYNELRTRKVKEAQSNPSIQFRRTIVPSNAERLTNTIKEQIKTARRINRFKQLDSLPEWEERVIRTAYKDTCMSCGFKTLCAAELNGIDPRLILQTSYREKESHHDSVVDPTF